jgi:hypothetical protein
VLTSLRRFVVPVAITWVVVAALLILQLWPDLPASRHQWALFLGFGPPIVVAVEGWASWVLAESRGWAISKKRFSVLRIILLLPVVLFYFAVAWWSAALIGVAT